MAIIEATHQHALILISGGSYHMGKMNDRKFIDGAAYVCLFFVFYDNFAVFDIFWGQGSP